MSEKIYMRFPANTEYIGTIRLATSGLAGLMDFTLDEIEDLKTCVSESCILILCGQTCSELKVEFEIGDDIKVDVRGADARPGDESAFEEFNDEISRIMIEALSDSSEFEENDGILRSIQFIKRHAN